MRMNRRARSKWVTALRSGEYSQGRGDLITPDGHCCLGVLADEVWPEFVRHPDKSEYGDCGYVMTRGEPCGLGTIPSDLAATVDLADEAQDTLADMNDGGSSFGVIADWIEENL